MNDIVIDSSVAIKWLVPEVYSAEARRILDDYQTGALNFLAPDLINAEVGNVLWKKHLFQGLPIDEARGLLTTFRGLSFVFVPTSTLLAQAYELAVSHKRTVYDMLYVALSLQEGCQFVTGDEKLANALGAAFPDVIWVGNWP
jgi:predicted nucleic acid-binding protein